MMVFSGIRVIRVAGVRFSSCGALRFMVALHAAWEQMGRRVQSSALLMKTACFWRPETMRMKLFHAIPAACLLASLPLWAAEKPKSEKAKAAAEVDPYAEVQPATETLDLAMYQKIRDEGLNHSHVMEFASGLMDGIGPRLTGSPNAKKANEWTRDTLTKIGCVNAHLEDWGEFGLGWQQLNTWARMVSPDTAVLALQATPWSPSTSGPVTGDVVFVKIDSEKDLDTYKGKLT